MFIQYNIALTALLMLDCFDLNLVAVRYCYCLSSIVNDVSVQWDDISFRYRFLFEIWS